MNRFDYIIEKVTSIPRLALDPNVFQYFDNGLPPIFKDGIKAQIAMDIESIRTIMPINTFYSTDGILLPTYKEDTPINVSVLVDNENVDAVSSAELLSILKKLNDRLAVSTMHPLHYEIVTDESDKKTAQAVYDIINERWIKTPDAVNPEIAKYITAFDETINSIDLDNGRVIRNRIDLDAIKNNKARIIKNLHDALKLRADKISEELTVLAKTNQNLRFIENTQDISKLELGQLNNLINRKTTPDNIIAKIYQKYYYQKFLNRLNMMADEKQAVIPFKDVPAVKRVVA